MLRLERNAKLKQFTITFLLTVFILLQKFGARASAKVLSDVLVRYAVNVDTEGKYLKAVAALCNIRNRNNMLQDSKDVYFFSNEQLDVNDYLLNVQNGTLDLSGNEPVFLSHSPDMLLS